MPLGALPPLPLSLGTEGTPSVLRGPGRLVALVTQRPPAPSSPLGHREHPMPVGPFLSLVYGGCGHSTLPSVYRGGAHSNPNSLYRDFWFFAPWYVFAFFPTLFLFSPLVSRQVGFFAIFYSTFSSFHPLVSRQLGFLCHFYSKFSSFHPWLVVK